MSVCWRRIARPSGGWSLPAAVVLVFAVGCGRSSSLEKAIVSGKVTYQGRPVDQGMIRFVPTKETKGPAAAAMIVQGEYTVKAAGGVPVGTHQIGRASC